MSDFILSDSERNELAPDGMITVGIAVGPAVSAVWCARHPTSLLPQGVTISLAEAIGERTGLPVRLVEFSSSGDIVDHAGDGSWTLSFVPIDEYRRGMLAVGPDYYRGVSTFLTKAKDYAKVGDVDRAGVRVFGISGTATLRSAEKWLNATTITGLRSLDEALAKFQAGDVDALALGYESIVSLLPELPECHAVEGHFHAAGTAIVVPKHHMFALSAVSRMLRILISDGTVRRAFEQNGLDPASIPSSAIRAE